MNLTQIKSSMGYDALNLVKATTEEGEATEWFKHWDNDKRIAVSLHQDLVAELQSNPELEGLGVQTETRKGKGGDYLAHRIVKYNIDVVL